jgi:hypothetical protein
LLQSNQCWNPTIGFRLFTLIDDPAGQPKFATVAICTKLLANRTSHTGKDLTMADLTITAANVAVGSQSTRLQVVQVGEAVTQGQPLYRDSTTDLHLKADANVDTKIQVAGIALTPAAGNGFVVMATGGLVNLGATLTIGTIYVLSDTVGGIMPSADLGSGDNVVILGAARTTALLSLAIQITGAKI